jgi:putative transposase
LKTLFRKLSDTYKGSTKALPVIFGGGALGFWRALRQVFPTTREQRCTVHKTVNVLNNLPKSIQPQAKRVLHEIWQAPTRAEANKAFDLFLDTFEAKYPQATTCPEKDRTELLAFYDSPAENWCHIRTTNPIESTFATIRLRKTRGCGSAKASLTMMLKLAQSAAKGWRKLQGHSTSKTFYEVFASSTERTSTRSKKRNVPQKTIHPKKPSPEPTTHKHDI